MEVEVEVTEAPVVEASNRDALIVASTAVAALAATKSVLAIAVPLALGYAYRDTAFGRIYDLLMSNSTSASVDVDETPDDGNQPVDTGLGGKRLVINDVTASLGSYVTVQCELEGGLTADQRVLWNINELGIGQRVSNTLDFEVNTALLGLGTHLVTAYAYDRNGAEASSSAGFAYITVVPEVLPDAVFPPEMVYFEGIEYSGKGGSSINITVTPSRELLEGETWTWAAPDGWVIVPDGVSCTVTLPKVVVSTRYAVFLRAYVGDRSSGGRAVFVTVNP